VPGASAGRPLALSIGGRDGLPKLALRPPPIVIVTGGGEEVGELVHDGRGELPAAPAENVPRRTDADPASVRVFRVLVGVGVNVRGQPRGPTLLGN
jgi:hypothetical protein